MKLKKNKQMKRNPFYDRFEIESDIKQPCGTRRLQKVKRKVDRAKNKNERIRNW